MLEVVNVVKTYRKSGLFSRGRMTVLNNVSFRMRVGECLGILGESGSGKSTLSRLILGIEKPDSGEVLYRAKNVLDPRVRRGNISVVFQDYRSSCNPNYTVYDTVIEPLVAASKRRRDDLRQQAEYLLRQVGLDEKYLSRYPHELSGGEAQRICIARAIAAFPALLILDEAVSSVDMLTRLQILDLLLKLKQEMNMSYLFITHDIKDAVYICGRILFFCQGSVMESADIGELNRVKGAYARKLLALAGNTTGFAPFAACEKIIF